MDELLLLWLECVNACFMARSLAANRGGDWGEFAEKFRVLANYLAEMIGVIARYHLQIS